MYISMKYVLLILSTHSIRDSETSIDFVQGPPSSRREWVKRNLVQWNLFITRSLGPWKLPSYQVSRYIRVKKLRNIKSWDQQNDLVIRGFCYIRPLYNGVLLYSYSFPSRFRWVQYTHRAPAYFIGSCKMNNNDLSQYSWTLL